MYRQTMTAQTSCTLFRDKNIKITNKKQKWLQYYIVLSIFGKSIKKGNNYEQ